MPDHLSDELLLKRKSAEAFILKVIDPLTKKFGADITSNDVRARVVAASKREGFYYKTQPAEFGGQPAGIIELTMLRELWAAANSPLTDYIFGPGPGILHAAEGDLKRQYLDPVMRGEKRGAFGFTEPDTARRPTWGRIDGQTILVTGQKSYVTGGAEADFVSTLVNIQDSHGGKLGTAMLAIDMAAEGVLVEREFASMEGSGHISITFNAVRVPISNVIGEIGQGLPRALENIGNVRLMVSARATGMCMWVIDFVRQHLLAPHRTGTPLGEREAVRLRYADMRIEAFAARSALYRTARIAESGENAVNETSATKIFCTEVAGRVVDMAVQLVGGQALVQGHALEKAYRQARSLRLIEGANDLLRINLAKGSLDLGKGAL